MRAGIVGVLPLCLALLLAACQPAAPTATPLPTITPTAVPTRTPFVLPTPFPTGTLPPVTPTVTPIFIDTYTGQGIEPPLTLALPAGWRSLYDTALVPQLGELDYIPVAVYSGPVTGGSGTLALLWNFRSITSGNPFDPAYGEINLWSDGLRLLRSLVVEIGCNVGTAPQRNDFVVGGLPAVGTIWSAVDCPALGDTRGWFAGVQVQNINFIFYAFTDPISAMDGPAPQEMQAILDSVTFRLEDWIVTATPAP
ncbi:MAG: hypothetical protein MUE40_19315 [Anaerolineae bacterium]|nr:hypothetical protein [Anaerolineae bacterium]